MLNTFFLIFGLGTTEIILIVLVVLLLFGGRKIPELMKGIGKGFKSFKDGMHGMEDDLKDPSKKESSSEKNPPPQDPAG
ncbi:MAG: twin-arginine translocase TatA/TatE family subunit [bacterium]